MAEKTSIHIQIDGNNCFEPEAKQLWKMINHQIGYMWWCIDVLASGETIYDPSTKVFRGTLTLVYVNNSVSVDCNIENSNTKYIRFRKILCPYQ